MSILARSPDQPGAYKIKKQFAWWMGMKIAAFCYTFLLPPIIIFNGLFASDSVFKEQPNNPVIQSKNVNSILAVRKYYLTQNLFRGDLADAVGTCAPGYHFASLWEILDLSNLVYDSSLGYRNADSGKGPPSPDKGWIRTGYQSDVSTSPGKANCDTWSTTVGFGSVIGLSAEWVDSTAHDIGPWDAAFRSCADTARVWCVSDVLNNHIFLPLVTR